MNWFIVSIVYFGFGALLSWKVRSLVRFCSKATKSGFEAHGVSKINPAWIPFLRPEMPVLNENMCMLRSFLIGPFKLSCVVGLLVVISIYVAIFGGKPTPPLNFLTRLMTLVMGVLRIEVQGSRASDCHLTVSNHMGFIDSYVLFMLGYTFLANSSVRSLPFFGYIANQCECIFVKRESKDSRSEALDNIGKQMTSLRRRLVIFPEGTTTAGKHLIQFKDGSFKLASRIQPVNIFYSNPQYSFAMLSNIECMILNTGLPLMDKVTVRFLPVVPKVRDENPREYGYRVRSVMAKDGKFEIADDSTYVTHCEMYDEVCKW